MLRQRSSAGAALVASMLGARAPSVLQIIDLDMPMADGCTEGRVSSIAFAAALNAVLFDGILQRVPTGAAFVADQQARGKRISFDHGALRTVRFPDKPTGALPAGHHAIGRILAPLGYVTVGNYPLLSLRMTGHAWAHRDLPAILPQFFVSELHVEAFSAGFQEAAERVFAASRDPLDEASRAVLADFEQMGSAALDAAISALPVIAACFECHHASPSLADYQRLLSESAEAAWIATEGTTFNHATSRVADVVAEAKRQRQRGLPLKDRVEVSESRRVRQTAFRADLVERSFIDRGAIVTRSVPGSFYEIISRDIDPATGRMDLRFDSGNATGIFAMTRAA